MNRTYGAAPLLLLVFAGAAPAQLPPPPIEIEADAVFRESFIAVMDKEPGEWQLQPTRSRGPAPTGRPPLAHEEMTWRRRDNKDALPAGGRNVIFRRGSFVFEISARSLNTDPVLQPSSTIALSKAFLDAADRVVIDADARWSQKPQSSQVDWGVRGYGRFSPPAASLPRPVQPLTTRVGTCLSFGQGGSWPTMLRVFRPRLSR